MARYFRCEEPSGQCEHARTRAVLIDQPGVCPNNNPNCANSRRPVPLLTALRERNPAAFWGLVGLGGLVMLALLLSLLLGGAGWRTDLARLQTDLAGLNDRMQALATQSPAPRPPDPRAWADLNTTAQTLLGEVAQAVGAGTSADVAGLRTRLQSLEDQQQRLLRTAGTDPKAAGLKVSAQQFVREYQTLKASIASAQATSQPDDEEAQSAFATLGIDADKGLKRAQRLAQPSDPGPAPPPDLVSGINAALAGVRDSLKKLDEGQPPFPPEQARLTIVTSPVLARSLILPLLKARFADAAITAQPGGQGWSIASADPLISPGALVRASDADTYQPLLAGTTDLIVSDQPPDQQVRGAFAQAFPGADPDSRASAEVIALDAIVLLGHPNRANDPVTDLGTGRWGAQAEAAPALRRLAPTLALTDTADPFTAVLEGPDTQAVTFHHQWQPHLPAQLLAYQPSPKARVLKPSAFSIATEDYALSYRVRATWSPRSRPATLDLVTWITSEAGQSAVTAAGFVDLHLDVEAGANPVILAALGAALGRNVTSAHRYSTNLRFALNQAALDLKTQADLNRLPPSLAKDFPDGQVVILGFTDNTGGSGVNCPLSQNRAGNIAERLHQFGIEAAAAGLCEQLPVDTNDTEAGRARNRRSEVWVVRP